MEIKLSECIGFCFGVKQAVDLSNKALQDRGADIFSVGPLIHNPQVVKELSKRGLRPLDDIRAVTKGTVIISSHGAGAGLKERPERGDLEIIDATCPFVRKIQDYVKKLHREGYKVVIVGKREHPEVNALVDFTDGTAVVIKDRKEAAKIALDDARIGVVSQSTYSGKAFLEIVSILSQGSFLELRIFNTICKDTIRRQDAVRRLANVADAIIVVGGKNSANTRRLVEVCREEKKSVYHIEEKNEIEPSWLADRESVGIASGASTPDWVVRDVIKEVKQKR